ncbi:MAG: hypothetical protein ACRDQ7_15735 [Haloechinothrix sp.]
MLFAAGVVLADQAAPVQAGSLSAAALVAAVAGNLTGYAVGARTGTLLIARTGGRLLHVENVSKVRRVLDRRGFVAP